MRNPRVPTVQEWFSAKAPGIPYSQDALAQYVMDKSGRLPANREYDYGGTRLYGVKREQLYCCLIKMLDIGVHNKSAMARALGVRFNTVTKWICRYEIEQKRHLLRDFRSKEQLPMEIQEKITLKIMRECKMAKIGL